MQIDLGTERVFDPAHIIVEQVVQPRLIVYENGLG